MAECEIGYNAEAPRKKPLKVRKHIINNAGNESFIGIELDPVCFEASKKRISEIPVIPGKADPEVFYDFRIKAAAK